MQTSDRLESLDLLRGLTIVLMIVVNSPGTWEYVFGALRHSAWDGLTLADTVFPCFLFMMGITTFLSLRRRGRRLTKDLTLKIVRRTALLFLLGLLINYAAAMFPPLSELRIPGVLQRFAVCYLAVSLLAVCVRLRAMALIAALLLIVYALLTFVGGGFTYGEGSVLSTVDQWAFGAHMLNDGGCDPEGLLSTLPSIAHTLLGYLAGWLLTAQRPLHERLLALAFCATSMLFLGFLLSDAFPINKRVWSATFVLVTCGLSLLALIWFAYVVDVKHWPLPRRTLRAFGMNPLFCYIVGELTYIALYSIPVPAASSAAPQSLQDFLYGQLATVVGNSCFTSLLFAFLVAAFVGILANALLRRGIVIRI